MLNEAKVQKMIKAKQVNKQKGASMIEYALVIAAVVGIGAVVFSGDTATSLNGAVQKMVSDTAVAINS